MAIGTFGLAFLAGLLSVLSPCVLPLLPIVLGAAASGHRMGPAASRFRLRRSDFSSPRRASPLGLMATLSAPLLRS